MDCLSSPSYSLWNLKAFEEIIYTERSRGGSSAKLHSHIKSVCERNMLNSGFLECLRYLKTFGLGFCGDSFFCIVFLGL